MKICLHSLHKIFHNPTYKANYCSGCKEYVELNRFRLWTMAKIQIEVDTIVYTVPLRIGIAMREHMETIDNMKTDNVAKFSKKLVKPR